MLHAVMLHALPQLYCNAARFLLFVMALRGTVHSLADFAAHAPAHVQLQYRSHACVSSRQKGRLFRVPDHIDSKILSCTCKWPVQLKRLACNLALGARDSQLQCHWHESLSLQQSLFIKC
jgi:hypothetical protein